MKKAYIIGGAAILAAGVVGAMLFLSSTPKVDVSRYWDGKSAINQKTSGGELALVMAVEAKDIPAIMYLMEQGADVDLKDKDGLSAVGAAAKVGDDALFDILAAASQSDFKDTDYLNNAIESGNVALVKALIAKGADVNAILEFNGKKRPDDVLTYSDPRVITPLKKAVQENKTEIADVLLENGAEGAVWFFSEHLISASTDMVRVLAKYAGDLQLLAVKGMDVLTYAAGEATPETLAFLLEQNAGDGNAALKRLLSYRKKDNQYAEAMQVFLDAGSSPDQASLELVFQNKQNAVFDKLAKCFKNPNFVLEKTGRSLIYSAIESGNVDVVKTLLAHGADVHAVDKDGVSVLEAALRVKKKNPETTEAVLAKIKDANEPGYEGETLLMLYAKTGLGDEFVKAADEGADIWLKDKAGKTVLMYAAEGGDIKVADYLIYKGDNLAATDKEGKTPLMYAAEAGQVKMVKHLMQLGSNASVKDNSGENALMYAAGNGYTEIASELINRGESPADADNEMKTVLMYAAEGGALQTVRALLDRGIDSNARDRSGRSALHYAVLGGNPEVVSLLIKKGSNPLAVDNNNYFPIMLAAQIGKSDVIDELFSTLQHVSGYTRDNGKTVAHYAVEGGNERLIKWLIRFADGAGLTSRKDNQGKTFAMELAKSGRPEDVRAIAGSTNKQIRDAQGKTIIMYAAEHVAGINLITILKSVGELEASALNMRDNRGRNALVYAVSGKNSLPVKSHTLLTRGVSATVADNEGKSVLMHAVGNTENRVDIMTVRELLEADGDVNRKDNYGKTALMYAAANPQVGGTIITELLNAGALANATDKDGKSVLMYAAEGGSMSKYRLLLSAGAKDNVKDFKGKGVKEWAEESEYPCFAAALK